MNVRTIDIRTGTCCTCAPSGAGGASHSTGSFREDFAEGACDRLRVKQTKVSLRLQEVCGSMFQAPWWFWDLA